MLHMGFIIRTIVTAVAFWVATLIVDGIEVTGGSTTTDVLTLLAVAVIFGLINAILKPLVKIFGCFFYVITLGLIAFVVNALLLMLTDWIAGLLDLPFRVDGILGRVLGGDHHRCGELVDQPRDPRPKASHRVTVTARPRFPLPPQRPPPPHDHCERHAGDTPARRFTVTLHRDHCEHP